MSETKTANKSSSPFIRAVVSILIVVAGLALLYRVNPGQAYLWIKAIHVIAVIAWMAGMLYLPRLFVYHTSATVGSEMSETFKLMERRLMRFIINPAMIVTWIAGLWMAWAAFGFKGGWLHGKILLVILLSGVHGYLSKSVRRFAADSNTKSAKHWRIVNEIPTVLMILIVILVVVKPF